MKRLISMVALLGLFGICLTLTAQQTPSATQSAAGQGSAQQQAEPSYPQTSARTFEGKITKSGDHFVLQDSATQMSLKLDDQDKARQFEGMVVKVMATVDENSKTLHVVDIIPSEGK